MRSSEKVLGMLRDRGKRGVPVDDLYRQLYNPSLYLRAYGRIYANDGAMTAFLDTRNRRCDVAGQNWADHR